MTDPTPEQIEAAAKALYCAVRCVDVSTFEDWPEWVSAEKYREHASAALVAAAGAAPQEPSEQAWLALLMPDSGAHKTREWRGVSASEDDAIERAMNENPGWSVHTFGPDVKAKPQGIQGGVIDGPRWPDGCPLTLNELPVGGPENYKGHIDCKTAAAPERPTLCAECKETEVLGVPEHRVLCMDCAYESGRVARVRVDGAKLAEVISDAFLERYPREGLAEGAARRAVERRDEWLRGGGR